MFLELIIFGTIFLFKKLNLFLYAKKTDSIANRIEQIT